MSIDNRIAILEGNIRQLVEEAPGSSGARDEERISDRIAQQNEQLEKLIKARDALLK
jgi:predicted RNA-binding protein